MADLDDELLALAGGDSSDSEASVTAQDHDHDLDNETNRDFPPSPPPDSTNNEPEQKDSGGKMGRKGVARSVVRRKKAKKDEDEEEEGEVPSSPASQNSLDSAPMSESEAEEGSENGELEGPVFPYEKLYYSEKDKQEILALPEIQREEILSDRAQQVDRRNQDIALRRLLAMRQRQAAQPEKRKRKASAAEPEETQRKSSRQKTTLGGRKVGEASGAIEAYKRQREQKGKREEQRRREASSKKDEPSASPDRGASEREGHESEVEWDEGRRQSPSPAKDDPPADLHDFERARVGRLGFGQVCFYPGFEEAITGCYVRVNVGQNPKTGQDDYRMCLIKKITEGKPYALEGPNGRNFVTTQYALLAQGKSERDFPLIACSEGRFTEPEFNRYRQTMIVEGFKMPTKSTLLRKNQDIHRLLNHQFTKEELDEKLRRQGANDNKMLVFDRIQLERRRQLAIAAGDEAAIAECDAELAKLTGPKLAFGTALVKPRTAENTQQDRLEEINRRNQKLNTENIRKAQLEERKRERMAAAAVARGEALPDRFARVKTRARTHYDVNGDRLTPVKRPDEDGSGISRSVTPQPPSTAGANTPKRTSTPKPAGPTSAVKNGAKEPKGVPTIRHRPYDDEVIGALDFDIDIEL